MKKEPKFKFVPLASLDFDAKNPRLPSSIDGGDDTAVLNFMLEDASLEGLMRSIAQQGFFAGEPLLVSHNNEQDIDSDETPDVPDENSKTRHSYTVIEGNRRLAACKLLSNPDSAPAKKKLVKAVSDISSGAFPEGIPCLIFETREEVLAHLGYRHVTGIKEWDPLAKARFLKQYFDNEEGAIEDRLRTTARSIGSRADYVGRLLTSLALYEHMAKREFYGMDELDEESVNFSLISSNLAYADTVAFLGLDSSRDFLMPNLDEDNWELVAKVIFEKIDGRRTRLGDSRNIRTLSEVLSQPSAVEELRSSDATLEKIHRKHISVGTFSAALIDAEESIKSAISTVPKDGGSLEDRALASRVNDASSTLLLLINKASDEAK